MVFSNNLLMGAAGQSTGYEIDKSIRFNDDDAAYLYRDNDAAQTDTKKFTYSLWIKRTAITGGTNTGLLSGGSGTTSGRTDFTFTAGATSGDGSNNDALKFDIYTGGWTQRRATAKIRDASAWYHIVLVYDAANSTANDTLIIYQNGTRLTLDSTSGVPNNLSLVNANSQRTKVGADASNTPVEFDGYMAEINMIDGQALAPTALGETNDDGVWVPKAYSGTYGDNGFYITGATDSDLGEDFSGNNNDFTSTGLTAADQVLDTPTLNFNIINGLDAIYSNTYLTNGALQYQWASPDQRPIFSTIQAGSGKFYCEVKRISGNVGQSWGVAPFDFNGTSKTADYGQRDCGGVVYESNGVTYINGTSASYGSSFSTETIGIALNLDDGQVTFYVDNSSQGAVNLPSGWDNSGRVWSFVFGAAGDYYIGGFDFGQLGFEFTPPTGYKALNTANLATPTIADGSAYFQPTLYEGNGSTQSIDQDGNSTFQPDWVWIKNRDATDQHALFDVVRGATELMGTNATTAEATNDDTLTGFESDGFALGDDVIVNTNNESYVAWQWKANGSGSSNEDGSINTTATTANTTAGFSISTYTGNATVGATVGHGLGIAPKVVIVKSRSNVENWIFGHDSVGWNKAMYMSSTGAPFTLDIYWNNTAPTSSVVTLHDHVVTNGSGATYVMYSFAEIPGYSSFGSYTGNGSATDGTFVYTGFTPRYVLFKRTNAAESWPILDTARGSSFGADAGTGGDNPTAANDLNSVLVASTTAAEEDNASGSRKASFNSNGFKVRTTNTAMNGSGSTYIYMAFAEHPFGGEDVAPATAR